MEIIEMVGWLALGFVPTLVSGNGLICRHDKGKFDKKSILTGMKTVRISR